MKYNKRHAKNSRECESLWKEIPAKVGELAEPRGNDIFVDPIALLGLQDDKRKTPQTILRSLLKIQINLN